MDLVKQILHALEIDGTFFHIFLATLVVIFLLEFLLMTPLKKILVEREEKTTKMDSHADAKFAKANELQMSYDSQIGEAKVKALEELSEKKKVVVEREKKILEEAQEKEKQNLEEALEKLEKDYISKKEVVMSSSQELTQNLINKLSQ